MCEKHESDVSESFVKGLNAMSEDDKQRFSVKSRGVKDLLASSLS
ncbi:MAG: hypothetical protein N3F04_02775 [Candidatus Nezhaarchaeota archaeon]|nr:hypothetical protein [Candidatus Nezhaarchaeota archaeon]MCX8141694.1 hypothetical protein [Candidatus Nezhaarchaeota archaeon]MDW8049961.1 hypothetical protein [Nitrososphaerota archaeon]